MKTAIRGFWDLISDPRLKMPLLIAALCLSLVLLALVLLPDPTPAPARAQADPAAPDPAREAELSRTPEEEPSAGYVPEDTEAEIIVEPAEELQGCWEHAGGKDYYRLEDGSFAVGLRLIEGKLYYFDQDGVKAKSLGIDVSYYNSEINWELVRERGVDFVIIRVGGRGWTYGNIYDDCRTQEYLRRAREAGLKIGVYFYSTAINPREAVEEAGMTLRALGGIPLDLPIFIDMEFSGEFPLGRADRLSPSERVEIATAFCETVRNTFAISHYTIWLASYTADNLLPDFSKPYDIWQFTDRGKVDGIRGYVDLDVVLNR